MIWKLARFNLTKGYHNFLWNYISFVEGSNPDTRNLKAYIDYIKIDGIEYADTKCTECVNKFSEQGSESCIFCNYNYYFNEEAQACVKCPNSTYSFPNSIGNNSCMNKHPCTENDYTANYTKCVEGKRKVIFQWDEPLICDNSTSKLPENYEENCSSCSEGMYLKMPENECTICSDGFFSNNETFKSSIECQECPVGRYPVKVIEIKSFENLNNFFDNHCSSIKSENCMNNHGFKNKLNKLISGNYLPSTIDLNLVINFEVVNEQGEISYNFKLTNMLDNESFIVKINGLIQEKFEKNGNYEKNYILKKGSYQIIWLYQRNNCTNNNNSVEITRIFIKGSNLGGASSCVFCYEGYIKSKSRKRCDICPLGFTSNAQRSECVFCPQNYYNDGFTGGKCLECPPFTISNKKRSGCILLDILHNKKYLVKINADSVKDQIDNLCNGELEICYGSFMGPIKKVDVPSLFFISPFEAESINITDFSYVRPEETPNTGFVFGLFPKNRINKNTQTMTVENIKILQNLGKKIDYVKLFPYSNNSAISRDGFFIKYKEGTICLANPSIYSFNFYVKFTNLISFLYVINLETSELLDYYGYLKVIDLMKIDCTYIFEWRGKGACPLCTREKAKFIKSACYHNSRSIFFQEESNCNIFSTANKNLTGVDSYFNEETNIVTEISNEDSAVRYYFIENQKKESLLKKEYILPKSKEINIQINLTLNDSQFYLTDWREDEACTIIDDIDNSIFTIVIVVPILYILFISLLIYICCKYKKVKSDYQRLRDEAEGKDNLNTQQDNNNNKLEAE